MDFGTEMMRGFIAQRDQVQRSGLVEENRDRNRSIDSENRKRLPRGRAESTQQPEESVAHAGRIREHHDGAHQRAGKRADDHAGEQEDVGIQPPAGHEAEAVDQGHGGQGAEERGQRYGPGARSPGSDGDDRTQSGPAGESQQIRLGQRVPDHSLESGATDAEASAHQKREHYSWRSHISDDGSPGSSAMEEAVPDVAQGKRHRSGHQPDEKAAHNQYAQGEQSNRHWVSSLIRSARCRIAMGARGLGRLNSEPLTRRNRRRLTAGTTCHSGRVANAAGPSVVARIRSGFRAATASMLTTPDDVVTSANRFSPPARSISSLRKLPRPMVIGGCSQTSSSTLGRRAVGATVACANAVSNTAITESASRECPVSRPSRREIRGTSLSASVL